MGEHAESAEESQAKPRVEVDWRKARERTASILASVVRWLGLIFAALLVLHVIFVVGEANPMNGIVSFTRGWADSLSLGFKDLFEPSDAKLRVLVNYGIAAVFWLVVSAILAKIIRRIGGSGS
ncbi:hypothetical protein [Amycolatopsis sp. NPDC059021]|uniref:hypothetical protein n=1 Tax=Amycolatopsis sp. NPDC059021 TaxID=3346704 RepID=UPI00366E45B2